MIIDKITFKYENISDKDTRFTFYNIDNYVLTLAIQPPETGHLDKNGSYSVYKTEKNIDYKIVTIFSTMI